jgi:hypothetical protein
VRQKRFYAPETCNGKKSSQAYWIVQLDGSIVYSRS